MSLRAMSTPWLRAVCWANLLWVRMIPRHLCIIGQIFCLFCVKAMFVCFTNILESCNTPPRKPCRGHCHSLSNPTRQKTFLRTEDFQKKTSLEPKKFKKLLLKPKKFYQKPLPPPASLTQWVMSRNWVSTARPTQPALLVGAPCTSHIRPKLSLNNLDNMFSKNKPKIWAL